MYGPNQAFGHLTSPNPHLENSLYRDFLFSWFTPRASRCVSYCPYEGGIGGELPIDRFGGLFGHLQLWTRLCEDHFTVAVQSSSRRGADQPQIEGGLPHSLSGLANIQATIG